MGQPRVAGGGPGWTPRWDQSTNVRDMVRQLEGSVLTCDRAGDDRGSGLASAHAPALLVGFAIPTSFMLAFVLLGIMGMGDPRTS